MNLRVLFAASDPDEALFLQDVLAEMEEQRHFPDWIHIEAFHAECWSEAEPLLQQESLDALLLDLNLEDSQGSATFRKAQAAAPHVPIVLLVDAGDEALATSLVRNGAQDYLLKTEIDCAPLAHALRTAIERHRSFAAARASAHSDPLTGLQNRHGFLALADRDRLLAERLDRRWMMIAAAPEHLSEIETAFGEQRHDLELIRAAERIRQLAGPTDLIAWMGDGRFGMAVFEGDAESLDHSWQRLRHTAAAQGIRMGGAMFERCRTRPLEELLEEAEHDLVQNMLVQNMRL